jgi:hypothetical protein
MKQPPMPDLSTIDVAHLDAASLRLVTRAVEMEARRLRAQAMRDLLSQAGRFIRGIFSTRITSHPPTALRVHVP